MSLHGACGTSRLVISNKSSKTFKKFLRKLSFFLYYFDTMCYNAVYSVKRRTNFVTK